MPWWFAATRSARSTRPYSAHAFALRVDVHFNVLAPIGWKLCIVRCARSERAKRGRQCSRQRRGFQREAPMAAPHGLIKETPTRPKRLCHAEPPMCRLFGFRSVIQSSVHRSLLDADNALGAQSNQHPDGWGVAFYVDGSPHLTRSPETALGDQLFHRLSGVVASETVLAHVRKATRGANNVLNCHPFQFGRWVFAHNGDIPSLDAKRAELLREVVPALRRYILGDTDSEIVFFMFLTQLQRSGPLSRRHSVEDVVAALGVVTKRIRELCDSPDARCLLTVILTDGEVMVAAQGGKDLYFSTYKERCSDRETCPSLSPECEAVTTSGFVNHLLISSEPLHGENVWEPLSEGETIGVDFRMRLMRQLPGHRHLAIAASGA